MTSSSRFRILALDVDGTLLDREGRLRPETAAAVRRVSESGIRPVLCTGRRYRRARPVAVELGIVAPLVCNSGALVKEPEKHRTLWRAEFDDDLLHRLLRFFSDRDEPIVSFTDRPGDQADFLVEGASTGRAMFDDYLLQNLGHAEVVPGWFRTPGAGHYHLCAIGHRDHMLGLEGEVLEEFGSRVQTFVQKSPRYIGTMCEVLRADASKWSALCHLAELWDIEPSEICAVGDDQNDLPMIAGAGLGVSMGHAPPEVRAAADLVLELDDDLAISRFLHDWLETQR